jgi:hypothetical protein
VDDPGVDFVVVADVGSSVVVCIGSSVGVSSRVVSGGGVDVREGVPVVVVCVGFSVAVFVETVSSVFVETVPPVLGVEERQPVRRAPASRLPLARSSERRVGAGMVGVDPFGQNDLRRLRRAL